MTQTNTRGAYQTACNIAITISVPFQNNPLTNPNAEVFRIFEWKYDQILTTGVL